MIKRTDLLNMIEKEKTGDIFDPYDCCHTAAITLTNSLPDDLLPDDYYVQDREPVFCWGNNLKYKFITRYNFRVIEDGVATKRHQFGDSLTPEYIEKIKKHKNQSEETISIKKETSSVERKESKDLSWLKKHRR